MHNILEIDSLSIGYNGKAILRPITLTAAKGDMIALTGSNGLGKSTLLRVLSGRTRPLSGTVRLMDTDIRSLTPKQRAKLVSIVLTERPEDMFLKVKDVVASGRFPYSGLFGKISENDEKHIKASLEVIGINHLTNKDFTSLSDGERQKVMIAKAIAQDTPLILMDEPMAFLDYKSRIEIFELMTKMTAEEGKTVIFSSHDLDLVNRYCEKQWNLEEWAVSYC